MDHTQIEALKQVSATAHAALNEEQSRLVAAGYKSKERYTMLKDFKAAADKAHSEYSKFAKGQISKELDKIIATQSPAQRTEGMRRARGV